VRGSGYALDDRFASGYGRNERRSRRPLGG